jgi:hypothetical protein
LLLVTEERGDADVSVSCHACCLLFFKAFYEISSIHVFHFQ